MCFTRTKLILADIMSLVSAVEEAVTWCKEEQARINVTNLHYRDILQALTEQTQDVSGDVDDDDDNADADADAGNDNISYPDIVPEDEEEIELMEQALKKALQIHSATGQPRPNKVLGGAFVKPKDATMTPGASQEKRASTSKSSGKPRSSTSGNVHQPRLDKGGGGGASMQRRSASSAQGFLDDKSAKPKGVAAGCNYFDRRPRSTQPSRGPLGRAGAIALPPDKTPVSVWCAPMAKAPTGSPLSQNRVPATDLIATWKSLKSKQNRLWDKVTAAQRKAVPERSDFMDRMKATFPKTWPSGSPDQTRAQVDSLTHQGRDLTHCYQIQRLLLSQASADSKEKGCEAHLTLERLEAAAAELRKSAILVKQQWEAWDRWRPAGGCLCPVGAKGERRSEEAAGPPVPPTLTYTTEAELRELEALRMRVVLLQQEVHLQQALSDSLSPQLPAMLHGPGFPNPSVLRDVYSLLAEGGEQFPTLVLDNEPD